MAISTENGILAMLKTYYAKEGLQNLLYRNDPLLKKLKKNRIEGKQANFSALYSCGGAVSANYTTAKDLASSQAAAAEFQVTPGQLFSCCVFNNKELLASKTQKGAYINIASAKFFANAENFRKTMAVALYGTGHGELFQYAATSTDTIAVGDAGASATLTFPKHAIMGINVGSKLEIRTATWSDSPVNTLTVTQISGTTVTAKVTSAVTTSALALASKYICIAGCTSSNGDALLPVGLGAWIPATDSVTGSFFSVTRSVNRDGLAGSYIAKEGTEKKYETIERGILALRRMGSLCDMIVMNDEDYLAMAKELEEKTYFPKTGKGKTGASVGFDGVGFAVASNWVENVIDSPYCPKGTAYILDSESVELWTYGNADKINDGISDNEPGKPDVTGETDVQNKPYQLLVDDMFSVVPGADTAEGPAALVALQFYGQFVVTNPSVNGVVTF